MLDTQYAEIEYVAKTGVYTYPIVWPVAEPSHITLKYTDAGGEIQSVPGGEFSISPDRDSITISATFNDTILNGLTLVISRFTPRVQQLQLQPKAAINPKTLEKHLDLMEMQIQENSVVAVTSDDLRDVLNEARNLVKTEATERTAADNALGARITQERVISDAGDAALGARITQEIADRTAADAVLQTNINAEASARQEDYDDLEADIASEESARKAADITLQSNIDSEATARVLSDTTLQSNISAEAGTRAVADALLQARIDTEAANRVTGDAALQSDIATETANRISGDASVRADVAAETLARINADGALQLAITNEAADRLNGDVELQTNINAEAALRAAGDTLLQTNINAEATLRANGDSALDANLAKLRVRVGTLEQLGHYVGTFDTPADLPPTTASFPNGITINDFVHVRVDAGHDNNITKYIASVIDASGNITWTYDINVGSNEDKVDKQPEAVIGNFGVFDEDGNLQDSGTRPSTFMTPAQTANAVVSDALSLGGRPAADYLLEDELAARAELAAKLNLAGGTMTGGIAMGQNFISDLAYPIGANDAASRRYVDDTAAAVLVEDAKKLPLAGGTMTGDVLMSGARIRQVGYPIGANNAASKRYVDEVVAAAVEEVDPAGKLALAGGTMAGSINMANHVVTNLQYPVGANDAASRRYVDDVVAEAVVAVDPAGKLALTGGTMAGGINMGNFAITNLRNPVTGGNATNKRYVDSEIAVINTGFAGKLSLSGGTMTGGINMANHAVAGVAYPVLANDAASKRYVDDVVQAVSGDASLKLAGGTMAGDISMGGTYGVVNLRTPVENADAATKRYVDDAVGLPKLPLAGGTMAGSIDMGTLGKITNLLTPTDGLDAATKQYVDQNSSGVSAPDYANEQFVGQLGANYFVATNSYVAVKMYQTDTGTASVTVSIDGKIISAFEDENQPIWSVQPIGVEASALVRVDVLAGTFDSSISGIYTYPIKNLATITPPSVTDHSALTGRNTAKQHPMAAIDGLEPALALLESTSDVDAKLANAVAALTTKNDEQDLTLNATLFVRATGVTFSRAIGALTSVPTAAVTDIQSGAIIPKPRMTILVDPQGTIAYFVRMIDTVTLEARTLSTSFMGTDEPTLLGNVATHADLPVNVSAAETAFGRTPGVDDYAKVVADETMSGNTVEWYITAVAADTTITWGNPLVINTSNYQAQSTAGDSGKILTGGAVAGTYGTNLSADGDLSTGTGVATSAGVRGYALPLVGGTVSNSSGVGNIGLGNNNAAIVSDAAGDIKINAAPLVTGAGLRIFAEAREIAVIRRNANFEDSVDILQKLKDLESAGNGSAAGIPFHFIGRITPNWLTLPANPALNNPYVPGNIYAYYFWDEVNPPIHNQTISGNTPGAPCWYAGLAPGDTQRYYIPGLRGKSFAPYGAWVCRSFDNTGQAVKKDQGVFYGGHIPGAGFTPDEVNALGAASGISMFWLVP